MRGTGQACGGERSRLSELEHAAGILAGRGRRDWPIGPLTTYRVGGRAALFFQIEGQTDLDLAHRAMAGSQLPVLVLGKGSNLLIADDGFPGLVLSLGSSFDTIDIGPGVVRAGGAAGLPVLARRTAAAGLAGLEWAVGVPGSVGGGIRMNAGGHGSDVRATLLRAGIYDLGPGRTATVEGADLELGYRCSSVQASQVVCWGEFALGPGDAEVSGQRITEIVSWRRRHQPGGSNAGSVFVNPVGEPTAGSLVEAAGLRGYRLGTAQVSSKHANFIQADAHGSAADVRALVCHLQQQVSASMGIWLEPELKMVGFDQ